MKQPIFAYVILHYLTIVDTKKCVKSILNLYASNDNVYIIIVDNYSNNGTGEMLCDEYGKNKKIKVIFAKKNLGFARGNNLGYIYAKKELKADFIIMINNDTYILQEDFQQKVEKEYNESKFAVLGPKINLKNGKINAIYKDLKTIQHYEKDLKIAKNEYLMNLIYLYPIYMFLKKNLNRLCILLKIKKKSLSIDPNKRYENIVLHGCALIFSKEYINKFAGLDNRTFLYREEELLFLRLKKHNLKNVYNPEIEIYHNEDASTDVLTNGKRKKRLFVGKNLIISTTLLIKALKEDNQLNEK